VASLVPSLWDGPHYLNPAFAFDMERMRRLFDDLTSFAAELADVPRTGTSGFYWDNNFFPNFDAIIYYGLCRRFRPAIVLEIGSGFSTHLALRAAQQNGLTQVRCIEPYPTPTLQAIGNRLSQLLVQRVQDVPMDVFRDLRSGDILFVDTSHVSKLGGDLHHILFHVLPALPDGVLIHFHDIFLPREYPREWVIERNWFWNEQYLLLAFLMYNETFRVVFMNNHFLYMCSQVAERALTDLDLGPLQGASMWLRKEPRTMHLETSGSTKTRISLEEDPLQRDIHNHASQHHSAVDSQKPGNNGLAGEPWRLTTLPTDVLNVTTMLSTSERALLYWLACDYYTGAGEIVDAGCFVGGSTVSLAHGLIDGGHVGEHPRIHVYDLFISDSYMIEHYFKPLGIEYTSGESFRRYFDANTRAVASLLQVHQGDIRQIGWTGEPIEILFIDISKHWSINDVLLTDFFPCLMPGHSIVIQQDFVFEWCPWLALTMEYLADYFEYVAFVEHNSTVYLHTQPIPSEMFQVKLWDLPLQHKVQLMDRAIGRFSGYAKGMLECAKAVLLLESGQASSAIDLLAGVREHYSEEALVLQAAGRVVTAARQTLV
jgi:Methyltransferase domain